MVRVFVGLIICAGVAACIGPNANQDSVITPAQYERITFSGETATRRERARCEAADGEIRRDGLAGWEHCIQTMPDAGKSCSDSADCLDRCLIPGGDADIGVVATGQCSQEDRQFGCYQTVEDGRTEPTICVD